MLLLEELVDEVFLRLPPEEPEHLVCKPWRRILADRGFRRRYRELHGTPPLLGFLRDILGPYHYYRSRFVPTSSFRPAQPDSPPGSDWHAFDARHGRALFFTSNTASSNCDDWDFGLAVWDPTTGEQHLVPRPFFSLEDYECFTAAVLCAAAAQGCDHRCCQGGPFHVVAMSTKSWIISARLYSSETGAWSELTSVHYPNALAINMTSDLVDGALYFPGMPNHVIECQLGSLRLSVFEAPPMPLAACMGTLMTAEDGGLGFASVHDTCLILWSWATGAERWAQHNIIDLKTLLPDGGAMLSPTLSRRPLVAHVCGFAEGTHVIFVGTHAGVYMVELRSRQVRKLVDVDQHKRVYPYMSFYFPGRSITYVHITMYNPLS